MVLIPRCTTQNSDGVTLPASLLIAQLNYEKTILCQKYLKMCALSLKCAANILVPNHADDSEKLTK